MDFDDAVAVRLSMSPTVNHHYQHVFFLSFVTCHVFRHAMFFAYAYAMIYARY